MIRAARSCVAGQATGAALVLAEPLSFYGGVDPVTGTIIDRTHSSCGASIIGRVLVMPGGRGSSSSSSVLAEAIRAGTGPAAIVLGRIDPILPVAAIVAKLLYGLDCPILVCPIEGIGDGVMLSVRTSDDGTAEVRDCGA